MIFHWPFRAGEHAAVFAALSELTGGLCQRCGQAGIPSSRRRRRLWIHHERYAPELKLEDVRLLCGSCHNTRHHEPDAPKAPAIVPKRHYQKHPRYLSEILTAVGADEPAGAPA